MVRQQHLAPDQVIVHAILDGRDTPPRSGEGYLEQLEQEIQRVGIGRIGTVSGRYYSMDRDKRRERTKRAYDAYVRVDTTRGAPQTYAWAASVSRVSTRRDDGLAPLQPATITTERNSAAPHAHERCPWSPRVVMASAWTEGAVVRHPRVAGELR